MVDGYPARDTNGCQHGLKELRESGPRCIHGEIRERAMRALEMKFGEMEWFKERVKVFVHRAFLSERRGTKGWRDDGYPF